MKRPTWRGRGWGSTKVGHNEECREEPTVPDARRKGDSRRKYQPTGQK